jgi:structural maintenance of chromosomes protein 5
MTGGGGAPSLEYQAGSIMRVRMHNFLTYADAEVTPGPRLNMVVGPNGSGKSTILCAISLGLGSNYTALDRAGSVGDYVMRDKEKGWVEITLKGKGARMADVKIRRDLERGTNKSKWKVDDQPATKERVQEVVKALGIEVNNLCTFLPQEKVGKFTEMDAQQLLVETERALTATDLAETHTKLIDMQKCVRSCVRA